MKDANGPISSAASHLLLAVQLRLGCDSQSPCWLCSSMRLNRVAKPKGTRLCWHGTARSVLHRAWVRHLSLPALDQRLFSVAWSEPTKPQAGMQTSTAGKASERQGTEQSSGSA